MNRIFLIDFENVGLGGLNGIKSLEKGDCVMIFSGLKSPKLSLEDANRIYNSCAKVDIYLNMQPRKNALDFVISSYIGYCIGLKAYDSYIIISKDKGYEPAILAMKNLTNTEILLEKDIYTVVEKDNKESETRNNICEKSQKTDAEEEVAEVVNSSSSKGDFHNKIQSILKDTQKTKENNKEKNKINWPDY